MTDRGGHPPHFVPLLHDQFLVDMVKDQCVELLSSSHLIQHIEFLGEGIGNARREAEAQE